MSNKKPTGSAPDPSRDMWEDMKGLGKSVANEVRFAKRTGRSANPKSKIISALRWALNQGIDTWEHNQSDVARPSKKEITDWATHTAGEIMSKTAADRRDRRFYEFGFAVATALKAAYKKGWSLAAGNTTLLGHLEDASIADQGVAIPPKYKDTFALYAELYCMERMNGNLLIFETRDIGFGQKPVHVALLVTPRQEGSKVSRYDRGCETMSEGAVQALVKRGLMKLTRSTLEDGGTLQTASITWTGIEMAAKQARQQLASERAWRKSPAGVREQEALNRMFPQFARDLDADDDFSNFTKSSVDTFDAFFAMMETQDEELEPEENERPGM